MLQIAVCDDVPAHSERLLSLLEGEAGMPYAAETFLSADALMAALEAGRRFDLFFLDIELGSDNGVQLAKWINARIPYAQIIFVTSNIMHAVQVDEAKHAYFLVKPVEAEKLSRAFRRAVTALSEQTEKRVSIPLRGGGDAVLTVGAILYCERTLRLTDIHRRDDCLKTALSLTELEKLLPPKLFARPHNSFLVNLTHVVKTDWQQVFLDSGETVSISNQRRTAFREALALFVSR